MNDKLLSVNEWAIVSIFAHKVTHKYLSAAYKPKIQANSE